MTATQKHEPDTSVNTFATIEQRRTQGAHRVKHSAVPPDTTAIAKSVITALCHSEIMLIPMLMSALTVELVLVLLDLDRRLVCVRAVERVFELVRAVQ